MSLKIAVLHNDEENLAQGEACDALAVQGVREAARAIARSLEENGWTAHLAAVPEDPRELCALVSGLECDLVFNQVEALAGDARKEQAFAWLLELFGLAYTGSRPRAMALCVEKPLARTVLAAHGIAVPRAVVCERGDEPLADVRYPLIVKPVREDASHGIVLESVVRDEREARARARYVIERYAQAALLEEFVDGREVNVALVGTGEDALVLPPGEIDYSLFPPEAPHLVTYAGKWIETSDDYRRTLVKPAERLPEKALSAARAAYVALGLTDYGRVDLRLDARGEPFVIDVNPNPDLSPGAGFALAAERAGNTHAELIARIVEAALERAPAAARAR